MGYNLLTFRFMAAFFLIGPLFLLRASGMGMRPKNFASSSSSSFSPFTSSLDLSSSLSDLATAERNLLAFIRSCIGATSNAALDCPCAGNGKRCKDSLSICKNFKCVCDSSISTFNSASRMCVATATTTTTPPTTTTIKTSTTASTEITTTTATTTTTTPATGCAAKTETVLPTDVNTCPRATMANTYYFPVIPGVAATSDILDILNTHNNYRRNVAATNMRKLQWSACAAGSAQTWANTCPTEHDPNEFRTNPDFSYCGQNIGWGYADWESVIKGWYDEVKDFKYCAAPTGVVGHYTEVMWAETQYVGCGIKTDCGPLTIDGQQFPANTPLYVCNYCTGGNVITSPNSQFCPWKTADSTTKCSQCPPGTGCGAGDCLCAVP